MTDLRTSITEAFNYLSTNSIEIPTELLIMARTKGIKAIKAKGDMPSINGTYHDAITSALTTFFEGGSVAGPRNSFKRATTIAFGDAMDLGTTDGGGELPFTGEALDWFNARLEQEFANIESLFVQAKELRKEPDTDTFAWSTARADAYTQTVISVYNAARMFQKGNQLLKWNLGKTEKHCDTCLRLARGTTHRASWYIAHNYIPRQPGANLDCGGYHCDCQLTDPADNEVTI
jgi:hypothetical protein